MSDLNQMERRKDNLIENTLYENISDKKARFVFPTQTACDLWEDWLIVKGPVKSVATERFIAWDDFKSTFIKSQQKDRTSIPSTMRKVFASRIIDRNRNESLFSSLITKEHAHSAAGFTDWIASILPGLSMWKKFYDGNSFEPDEEDKDLSVLYAEYKSFLDEYSLFDPAWETPPFTSDGNHYYIFFPEILSDYFEYQKLLESAEDDITLIKLPESHELESCPVELYSNFRNEIKACAIKLREAHDVKKIDWREMAVSVPDIENYGPYLDRELNLYGIPHVMRSALPLTSTRAGSLFSLLQDCALKNFNYSSITSLLLNSEFPWKDKEVIQNLITFGQNNNCITSFDYDGRNYDVWEESFKHPVIPYGEKFDERIKNYYRMLVEDINALVKANSFEYVRDHYFEFKKHFFNESEFSENTDRIISRCISELAGLIDLEKEYRKETENLSHYSFFVEYLNDVKYLAQTKESGVQVLPYKTSACAPFELQYVIDASQTGISVVYRQLSFLREDKRKKLLGEGYEDPAVTDKFASLYFMNSLKENCIFTCSSKSLTGYAQPLSSLLEVSADENELLENDVYVREKNWYFGNEDFPLSIFETEKIGFENFKGRIPLQKDFNEEAGKFVQHKIKESMLENGKIKVSYSVLKKYFTCPRSFVFSRALKLEEQTNEAALMDYFAMGELFHKVMEIYCNRIKAENKIISDECCSFLPQSVEEAVKSLGKSYLSVQLMETTSSSVLRIMTGTVNEFNAIFEGCQVYGMETRLNYAPAGKEYFCMGFADCVLYDPSEDSFFLVDFKSSDGSIPQVLYAENELNELPDFQIPMYIYIFEHGENPVKIENACFFNVKDKSCKYVFGEKLYERLHNVHPRTKIDCLNREYFESTIKQFEVYLEDFCESVLNESVSISDLNVPVSDCYGCSYSAVCRRVFNVGKRK